MPTATVLPDGRLRVTFPDGECATLSPENWRRLLHDQQARDVVRRKAKPTPLPHQE